jgi:TetR/AcrR family transcriptional regulator, cholesterol catabolism regulator
LLLIMEAKERILLKSHELFNRYGIRSVSMDDIATHLGISKKTVYQYFTDKEELVSAVFTAMMEENRTICCHNQQQAENAIQEVFLAFDKLIDMFANMNPSVLFDMEKYHPAVYRKYLEFKNGFLYKMIRANIEKGINEGLYRPDIDIDILTRFRIHCIMLSFNSDVFPGNLNQVVQIEMQILEHFLYGLATCKGKELIEEYKQQRKMQK